MALVLLVSLNIYASEADDETRYAASDDNSYMDGATYVGSVRCDDCHSDEYDQWSDTLHPKKIQVASEETVVAPWDIVVTIPVADGVDANVTLTKNETGWWAALDDSGNHTYQVNYVLGGFGWKQRFVTQIGNSKYILPHQYNIADGSWVAYHATDWYDEVTGEPKVVAISQSWDRRCAGCHATGVELEFNDTSGEWMASYSELGIGCEGCHGPGSLHVSPPSGEERNDYIWKPEDSSNCANCHNRGDGIGLVGGKTTGYPLNEAGHTIRAGDDLDDYFVMNPARHGDGETSAKHRQQYPDYITHGHSMSLSTIQEAIDGEDSCLECHSTDYRLAEEDEKPTIETAEYDIECAACHAPHGSDNDHELRLTQEETCIQCHKARNTELGQDPEAPQKEMVEGSITIEGLSGDPWMEGEVTCTDCHMPFTAKSALKWDIASHSYYFISPEKSIEFDMPNSCTVTCHGEDGPGDMMTDQEAADHVAEWKAETTELLANATADLTLAKAALDAAEALGFSEADINATNTIYLEGMLARDWVEADGTMTHNHEWAEELLTYGSANAATVVTDLTPGSVTGVVMDGDGKAVSGAEIRIDDHVWDATGADGSFNFSIAPGVYSFDVYDGNTKEKSFDSTVTAGAASDAGDIKFEAEEESDDMTMWYIIIGVVIVVVLVLVVTMTRKGGEEE